MIKLKRLLGISGLMGLLAAAAFAAPASADIKADCTFHGDAKTEEKDGSGEGVQLVEGEGKFTFDNLVIVCVGDANKDGLPDPPDELDVTATGWYDNSVCGTGKALGTIDDVREADSPKAEAVLEDKKFAVVFTGTTGLFKWHDPVAPLKDVPLDKDDPESEEKENEAGDKDYSLAGYVQLGPPSGKTDPPDVANGECTKAFSATGNVLVHFES